MPLEEFVIKACLLADDSGYQEAVKEETLRDTLVSMSQVCCVHLILHLGDSGQRDCHLE